MPSTTDYLRNKFMKDGDDGIGRAERIIEKYGGTVNIPSIGEIMVPDSMDDLSRIDTAEWREAYREFWDAVQFLIEEWDYAIL